MVKSDMLKVVKKWYSDIADLWQKHKLVVVMRDNAGENKSQEIIEFFESVGVKNYFSTAHEQWQNGLAEAAINSIMMISRTVMVESGLGGRFWFKSALAAIDARNATYKERIGTTPWRRMHSERRMFHDFVRSVAGPGFTSTRKEEKRVNIRRELLKQSILDLSPTQARIHSSFRRRAQ